MTRLRFSSSLCPIVSIVSKEKSSQIFIVRVQSSPTAPNVVPLRLPTDFRYSNKLEPQRGSCAPCDRYRYVTFPNLEVSSWGNQPMDLCQLYFVPVAAALLVGAVLERPWPSLVTALHWALACVGQRYAVICLLVPLFLLMLLLLFARDIREHTKLSCFLFSRGVSAACRLSKRTCAYFICTCIDCKTCRSPIRGP